MQRVRADYPVALAGRCHACFAAELVTLVRFALGNTLHFGGMDTVNIVLTVTLLHKQTMC